MATKRSTIADAVIIGHTDPYGWTAVPASDVVPEISKAFAVDENGGWIEDAEFTAINGVLHVSTPKRRNQTVVVLA